MSLIIEAIRNMPVPDAAVTDDPVADLRSIVGPKCIDSAEKPDLVPGLISAMRSDAGIEEAVKEGYSLEYLRNTIARIIGTDHPHFHKWAIAHRLMNIWREKAYSSFSHCYSLLIFINSIVLPIPYTFIICVNGAGSIDARVNWLKSS